MPPLEQNEPHCRVSKSESIRSTSIEAYYNQSLQDMLPERRAEVFRAVWEYGPGTQSEILAPITNPHILDKTRSYVPRFSELEIMDLIEVIGERQCKVSTNQSNALVWDVTGRMPKPYKRDPRARKVDLDAFFKRFRYDMAEVIPYQCWPDITKYFEEYKP